MRKSFTSNILATSILFASFACSSKEGNPTTDTPNQETPPAPGDGTNPDAPPPNPNDNQPNDVDAGNNTTPDAAPPKEPTNQTECIAACEASHPTAAANNHQLDNTCFFGDACGNVCNNLGQGATQYPDATSAAKCNTGAANSFPIGTPSQACSNCLASTPACCDLWIAVFGSDEGKSLSECAHTCWNTFPN